MTKTVLQLVVSDETGDTKYRMEWPAKALAKEDPSLRIINLDAFSSKRYELGLQADLLVLFQSNDLDFVGVMRERKKRGLKTLVEYNDNFYAPQPWSPVAKEWSTSKIHDVYEALMKESDGILVTGPGLFKLFTSRCNTPVYIIQNHLPAPPPSLESLLKAKSSAPSFGWAGSLGHMADLLSLKTVIKEVLEEVPGSIFHVMGNEAIPPLLDLPPSRIQYTPWGGMNEYFSFWEPVWVGVLPLLQTPYNDCRSDIKLVEAASRGVLPISSDTLPYAEWKKHFCVASSNDLQEIKAFIINSLKNSEERIAQVEKLYNEVVTHRIGDPNQERLFLYKNHLPETSSPFGWNYQSGFHYVKGESDTKGKSMHTLLKAQEFVSRKNIREAEATLRKAYEEASYNADLFLALCRIELTKGQSASLDVLQQFRKTFPRDVRALQLLAKHSDEGALKELWNVVLSQVDHEDETWVKSNAQAICEAAGLSVQRFPDLLWVAEKLLLVFPFRNALRLSLAQCLEHQGNIVEAHRHFSILRDKKEHEVSGEGEMQQMEQGYLEAVTAALSARMKGSFS